MYKEIKQHLSNSLHNLCKKKFMLPEISNICKNVLRCLLAFIIHVTNAMSCLNNFYQSMDHLICKIPYLIFILICSFHNF